MAPRLQLRDQRELALGADPTANRLRVEAELPAHRLRGELLVSGQHHGADARFSAGRDGVPDARPHRVDQANEAEEHEILHRGVFDGGDGPPGQREHPQAFGGEGPILLQELRAIRLGQRDRPLGGMKPVRVLEDHGGGALGQEDRRAFPRRRAGHQVEGRHHAPGGIERDLPATGPRPRELGRIEPGLAGGHQQGRFGGVPQEVQAVDRGPQGCVVAEGRRGQQEREMGVRERCEDPVGLREAAGRRATAAAHLDPAPR